MKLDSSAAMAVAALAALPSLACSEINTPVYFNGPDPVLELTGQEDPPRIASTVTLRFRQPTQGERDALDAQGQQLKAADEPLHRDIQVPWVSRDKVHLEVLFTVKNLDTEPGNFDVVVDGSSEYTKYDENVISAALAQGNNDEPVYLPLVTLHPHLPSMLGPGEVYQGKLREDDLDEAAIDLDAMGRWSPAAGDMDTVPPFPAVLINRSEVSPTGMSGVPARVVTPALMEVSVTFSASKHMTCEWMLRVRDDEDRLWHVEGDKHFAPAPTLFTPMIEQP